VVTTEKSIGFPVLPDACKGIVGQAEPVTVDTRQGPARCFDLRIGADYAIGPLAGKF
jgi:hypothetical protein